MSLKNAFCSAVGALFSIAHLAAAQVAIRPGEIWLDNQGQHIQAHGAGILKAGETFYWFGENRGRSLDPNQGHISCYASTNLADWTFRGNVLELSAPTNFGPQLVLERPKVFYNTPTKKYVMYFHMDDARYQMARVGVAVSDTVDGHYQFLKSLRPLGCQSRDIGQFVDDDGSAYLIFEDRPKGFHIAKLSEDYLTVEKDTCLFPEHLESGALVHYDGRYYVVGSHLSGWAANPNVYATAKSLAGPWSKFKDIAPPDKKTYGSQVTILWKITGEKTTAVIFMGDIWKPNTQWDSRYLWMPLEIHGEQMSLPAPAPWTLDIQTGAARFLELQPRPAPK